MAAGIVSLADEMVFVDGVRGDLACERGCDELGTGGDV